MRTFGARCAADPWTDDDPDADFRIEPGERTEDILALYRDEIVRARWITAGASLDDIAAGSNAGVSSAGSSCT